ncbi:MAG: adenylate/guanylate cyclase domain-containing protein, partial [Alphaproteobacteria bacterium]
MKRRLSVILASDVVGYSRLMDVDEAGTLAALQECRREVIDPLVAGLDGRVVKLMGDGALVEFASVVNAVLCALDVQRAMAERNARLPEARRLELRIGINLGDVMVDGDDIYGEGVNVAARLQALAQPGGICISRQAYEQVEGKVTADFGYLGERRLKGISEPIAVYQVAPGEEHAHAPQARGMFADRPAVAVLPFANLSGDPQQDYLADGLTEDLIAALSAWRTFPVIARNSSFAYKGRAVGASEVSGQLGARYLVEGSVQRGGKRVRITAELVDASVGHQVWAERYDRDLDDLLALQEEISRRIAAIVEPELAKAEQRRSRAKRPADMDAWDYYQRGMWFLNQFSREGNARARE